MAITLLDKPVRSEGMYTDEVDGYTLYYNPLGRGGVIVVDQESERLVSFCDGRTDLAAVIAFDGRGSDIVMQEIEMLASVEVLYVSKVQTQQLSLERPRPRSLACWIHLTNRCNLACSYCYIHKSPGDMTPEDARRVLKKLAESAKHLSVTDIQVKLAGGEPLLRYRLLVDLIEFARELESTGSATFHFAVLTNGALVTEKAADFLRDNGVGVAVSLDGLGEVHDRNRPTKAGGSSYPMTMRGVRRLRESGMSPTIMVTVAESNMGHLPELVAFLLDEKLTFRLSLERDCDSGKPGLLRHEDELIEVLHRCYALIDARLPEDDVFGIQNFADTVFNRPKTRACGAGSNFLAVGHDLRLGVCGLGLAHPYGVVGKADLFDQLRAASGDLHRGDAKNYSDCSSCHWRTSCAGGCPLQTLATFGKFDARSPYCRVYRSVIPLILRIKARQLIREHKRTLAEEGVM
jgi:uncharacterized protein